MKRHSDIYIHHDGSMAYLPGVKAAVLTETNTTRLFAEPDAQPVPVTVKDYEEQFKVVPWGERNDLPQQLVEKVGKLPQMTANLWFNIVASYADGIKPVRITYGENAQAKVEPFIGNAEVDAFFEDNDMSAYLLEQLTDMHWFLMFSRKLFSIRKTGINAKL